MRKRDFQRLLKRYTATALASVLQVHPQTVRRWARVGVPAGRDSTLQTLDKIRQHEGFEEKTLRELMGLTKGDKRVPKVKRYNKPADSDRLTGRQASLPIAGFFSPALFLKVRDKLTAELMARGRKQWLASAIVTGYTDSLAGYNELRIQVEHPEANSFVAQAILSSGLQATRAQAIAKLNEAMFKALGDDNSRFYLRGVTLATYDYKGEDETKDKRKELDKKRRKKK